MTTELLPADLKIIEDRLIGRLGDFHSLRQRTIREAWLIGEDLNEAKALTEHGQWLSFLDRLSVSHDMAKRFMRLCNSYPDLMIATEYDSVDAALKALPARTLPAPEPEPDAEPDPEADEGPALEEDKPLSRSEQQLIQMDEKNQRIAFLEEELQDRDQRLETAEKQVEAIENDDRPQLAAGVQQIAEVKQELATCKQERSRATSTIKDLKRENAFLKRRVKELEKVVA